LQGVDNKEAKRLAGKLTKDVRSSVTDIRQSLQNDIQAKLAAIDPNVQKMLGGRSAWQVMADKIKRTNPDTETLEAMKDALDVLPEDQIPRFIRQLTDSRARRGARAVEELRAASMLARFGTHFRNIGTTVLNIGTQVPTTLAAAAVDLPATMIRKLKDPNAARQIYAGEAMAQVYGLFKGLPAALRQFGRNARAVRELVDPERVSAFGTKAGKVTTLPFKLLAAEDRFLFDHAFAGEMYRTAYRRAVREGKRGPRAFERAQKILQQEAEQPGIIIKKHIEQAKESLAKADFPIEEVPTVRREIVRRALAESGLHDVDEALELAERSIFTAREGRKFDKAMSNLDDLNRNLYGAVSLVAPFRRTPGNLIREAMRLSPVGAVTAFNRSQGPGAARQISQELGRSVLGSAALLAVWSMLDSGFLKLHPFNRGKTKAQRTTESALGTVSDSVTIGGYSVPIDRLEPLGSLLLATARSHERIRNNPEEESSIPEILAMEYPAAMLNQTFLEDFADLVEAVDDPNKLDRFAKRVGLSFVPGVVQEQATVRDPVARARPESFSEALQQSVGADRGLAKLGLFAEEQETGGLPSLFLGRTGRIKDDPLVDLMLKVGAVHEPPKTDIFDEAKVTVSDTEKHSLAKAKGAYQRFRLTRLTSRPGFMRLPPERQKKLLDDEFHKAGTIINKRARNFKRVGIALDRRRLLRGLL
jgi:hypothetical protein